MSKDREMVFCRNCNYMGSINKGTAVPFCPECNQHLFATGVSKDEWDELSKEAADVTKAHWIEGEQGAYAADKKEAEDYLADIAARKRGELAHGISSKPHNGSYKPSYRTDSSSDSGVLGWITNSFKSLVSTLFIISVFISVITGIAIASVLYNAASLSGFLSFLVFAAVAAVGVVLNILAFGLMATIIQLNETNKENLYVNVEILEKIKRDQPE